MAGLLLFKDLKAIADRAIAANLARDRDLLFFGISPQIATIVRVAGPNPASDLKVELDRLNNYQERTSDGFLLAIWLTNCADTLPGRPTDEKFFRDWAARVDSLTPVAPLEVAKVGDIIAGGREEAQNDERIGLAMSQLEDTIGALNRRATALMVSKRLHDALHRIQVNVLPLWRRGIDNMASSPDLWRGIVADRQRELRSEAQAMQGEFAILRPDDALQEQAAATVAALRASADKADAALAANDDPGLKGALLAVRDTVKDDMRNYAGKIEANREALDLGVLAASLTRLADHATDQALVENARKAASALAAIMQDLNLFGPQHRLWQDLDVQLWLLEEQFGYLSMGPAAFAGFNFQWDKIMTAFEKLAGQPPADWYERATALRKSFLDACPIPVSALPNAAASSRFEDFVLEVRRIFQTIDQRMKDICNLLREITLQLAQI